MFRRLRDDFRWRNYQGTDDEIGIKWHDNTDQNDRWTLYDTRTNGMVLTNETGEENYDDEFIPDGDVWLTNNDDLPGGLEGQ